MDQTLAVAAPDEPDVRPAIDQLFSALASPARLEMLRVLLEDATSTAGESPGLSITQVAVLAETTRFAASRHLSILRRVGLVEVAQVGRCCLHRLCVEGFERIEDWAYSFAGRIVGQSRGDLL